MDEGLGFKDLYSVSLKATYPIEVNGETIEVGETIAFFDKIQIANFQEVKNSVSANGGYDNRALIWWEETKEMRLNFVQGVFSKLQLALMTNSKIISNNGEQIVPVQKIEELESDENGNITLLHTPREPMFLYDKISGKKIKNWTINDKTINIGQPYKEIVADYFYEYNNNYIVLQLGQPFMRGSFSLIGKTMVKDDITGKVKTGIITIPKLRLVSDLSIQLGSNAIPQVGRLSAVAIPDGVKGKKKVMEITFLADDIDADI